MRFILALSLTGVLAVSGCAYAASPVLGGLYTKVSGPVNATSSQAGNKTGRVCASSILGIIATGDASIDAAKKAGGITSVTSVDFESTSILGLYATFCTIVHGN